jgi:ABC-2 type transport system ATP-binding protein
VLRMLMGLIQPTTGELRAFGHRVAAGSPVLSRIGSFVEGPGFLPHLSGAANLRLYWAATGRPAGDAGIEEALEIAGLGHAVHRRVATYSQGMRQRLAIAQAMLGKPDLLVLDEPTNGLDPPQIHAMRKVLRDYAAGGRTVLVSSHLLAEVEQTCSHVVVMHRGRLVAAGTVAEIVAGTGTVSFTVNDPTQAAAVLCELAGVDVRGVEHHVVHAQLDGLPRAVAVSALVNAGIGVEGVVASHQLEEAFLQLVGEEAIE